MTDRELFQMALDALEHLQTDIEWQYKSPTRTMLRKVEKALRARLAQPEPWVKTYSGGKPNYTQPIEQEPAAWGVDEGEGRCISLHDLYFVKEDADHMAELKGTHAKVVALYTAPPKKEWVGLTNAEYEAMAEEHVTNCYFDTLKYAKAIEAKLKDNNYDND
jgi:hypothetical protein